MTHSVARPQAEEAETEAAAVLIVDDDARLRASVKELLRAYGFRCLSADSGARALELLSQRGIDLMLLDLNMPGMGGQQVLAEAAEHFPETAVIVLSGETTFENVTEALRRGALDFLPKPCAPDELYRVLKNVLHKRDLEHEVQLMRHRLEASEQRYRFIVDNSPDIIYMLDEEGCFNFVNERVLSLLGYTREDLLGRHCLELVHPEDHEKARFAIAERRTGHRASSNVEFRLLCHERRLPYRQQESRSLPVELSSVGIYSDREEGGYQGTYGVARDISERKRAEELIQSAIFALARELELEVVAEGVENKGQAAYLRRLHCSRAQGFLLGHPMAAEQARTLLHR